MIRVFFYPIFVALSLSGCTFEEAKEVIRDSRLELGDVKINYYSDKSVSSLEVPPDLTSPSYENSFRLSEIVSNVDSNFVNLSNKDDLVETKQKILNKITNIEVKKFGTRRWIIVDKDPEALWDLSKQFLKEEGFSIAKSNKKLGIMETNYLENKPEVPEKNLGIFRSFFAKTVKGVNYTLPRLDKYKIRVEPIENAQKSEVFLSIHSVDEVETSYDQTLWQISDRDITLETEMLYKFMSFLDGDASSAREKILNAKDKGRVLVSLEDGINGYAKLKFKLNLSDTWNNLSWALTNLNIQIEDKDSKEKTFYIAIARNSDKGIFSKLFGEKAIENSYQIQVKNIDSEITEVYFNDISEKNEPETKEFSYEFFKGIVNQF